MSSTRPKRKPNDKSNSSSKKPRVSSTEEIFNERSQELSTLQNSFKEQRTNLFKNIFLRYSRLYIDPEVKLQFLAENKFIMIRNFIEEETSEQLPRLQQLPDFVELNRQISQLELQLGHPAPQITDETYPDKWFDIEEQTLRNRLNLPPETPDELKERRYTETYMRCYVHYIISSKRNNLVDRLVQQRVQIIITPMSEVDIQKEIPKMIRLYTIHRKLCIEYTIKVQLGLPVDPREIRTRLETLIRYIDTNKLGVQEHDRAVDAIINPPPAPIPEELVPTPGLAFQVHNAFKQFTPFQLDNIQKILFDIVRTPYEYYTNMNKIEYWNYIFGKISQFVIQHISKTSPESGIRRRLDAIQLIKNKITGADDVEPGIRILVGLCVDYTLSQPPEFINLYIDAYFQDSIGAYTSSIDFDSPTCTIDPGNISCAKGIYERFVLNLHNVLKYYCRKDDKSKCTPEYEYIFKNGFGIITLSDFYTIMNESIQSWSTEHLDNETYQQEKNWTENNSVESIKQDFIEYVSEKCKNKINAMVDDDDKITSLQPYLMKIIEDESNKPENLSAFSRMWFGGRSKRKTMKRKYKYSTRKKKNKNQRKTRSRRNVSRRNVHKRNKQKK